MFGLWDKRFGCTYVVRNDRSRSRKPQESTGWTYIEPPWLPRRKRSSICHLPFAICTMQCKLKQDFGINFGEENPSFSWFLSIHRTYSPIKLETPYPTFQFPLLQRLPCFPSTCPIMRWTSFQYSFLSLSRPTHRFSKLQDPDDKGYKNQDQNL